MTPQGFGALVGSAALFSLALACERGESPTALAPSRGATAVRTNTNSADVRAAEGPEGGGCTNASLEGAYGFLRTGGTSAGPLAAEGLVTYDGSGTWVTTATISQHGTYTFDAQSTGTYAVDPDCTGKVLSNGQEVGLFDLVDGGNVVLVLSEVAGDAISEVQKRVGLRSCSNADFEGAFGFVRTGTTPAGPLAAVGIGVDDGAGNIVGGRQLTSRNGVFTSTTVGGTYAVGADCQGKFFMPNGQEFGRFVLVEHGNEVLQISESPGTTVTGDEHRLNRQSR